MRKISFALLALISVQTLFPINIAEEWEAIRILEERIKSQYVYSWFALGASSLIAARFLSNRIAILEQELKEKWFWNPETQQEELPADADQTTLSFMYWGKQAATLTGCLALIWGIKQGFHVAGLRMYMKLKETIVKAAQEEEQEKQYYNQQNDPGFQRWRKKHPYGTFSDYMMDEALNAFHELLDPEFKQWRQANPGGSYAEYQSGGSSSSSSGAHPKPPKPAAPEPPLDDYYTILGVTRTATNAQIKRAYIALAKENHPDNTSRTNLDEAERKTREAKFKEVADAYDTLKDPTLKTIYDRNWSTTTEYVRRANVKLANQAQSTKNQRDAEAEAKRKAAQKH